MKIIFAAMVVICGCNLVASPIDDLTSPSPEIRAEAAKTLRATYHPPPQTNWDGLLSELKVGDTWTNVLNTCRRFNISSNHGFNTNSWFPLAGGAGQSHEEYRLDEAWLLRCSYWDKDGTLYSRGLVFSPKWIPVKSPTNFTGIWIEYHINGQKCLETSFKNGVRNGDRTCYSYDGSKVYVEHHDPDAAVIGWTEYYHSGGVKTKGRRDLTGRPIGVWTNYNEQDGTILNTIPWSKP